LIESLIWKCSYLIQYYIKPCSEIFLFDLYKSLILFLINLCQPQCTFIILTTVFYSLFILLYFIQFIQPWKHLPHRKNLTQITFICINEGHEKRERERVNACIKTNSEEKKYIKNMLITFIKILSISLMFFTHDRKDNNHTRIGVISKLLASMTFIKMSSPTYNVLF
jgi:hypothetical protein